MYSNRILKDAVDLGIIDLNVVREEVERMTRQKYLDMHDYSIWQGKNGKWYTKLPLQNGERRLVKRNTREDIESVVVDFYAGVSIPTSKPTFQKTFRMWLDEKIKLQEICQGTYDRYSTEFERFFKDTELYDATMDIITEEDLEDFIRHRIVDLKLTSKAYGNMRTLIIGTFKYAKRKGYTEISISSFFGDLALSRKIFTRTKHSDREEVFTDDEVAKLIKYFRDNPTVENYGLLLTFQCGIREGELSALKFSDLQGNKLHIQRSEVKYKDKDNNGKAIHEIVDHTKTDNGDRYIFLPQSAIDTINEIKRLNPDNDFMMQVGKRKIWTNTFNDRLYKACDSVGIPRRSMHKIRKTYGTILIDSGADESLVKSQMGHSDISTTKKYYYYSTRNDDSKFKQIERAIQF